MMQRQRYKLEDDPGWKGAAGGGNEGRRESGKPFRMALGVVGVRRLLTLGVASLCRNHHWCPNVICAEEGL
jgi:hypothetical protein